MTATNTTSHLDTTQRQLFELRFERVAPGHGLAALRRWYRGLPWQPEGLWSASAGRDLPAVVSLHRWPTLAQREAQFGQALDDAPAQQLRRASADGPAALRSAESWILVDSPAADALLHRATAPQALHELRVHKVLNGAGREAAEVLATLELPALVQQGALLRGLYELAIGPHRPILVTLLAWPDGTAPGAAWHQLDASPPLAAARDAERSRHRRRLFGDTEHYLLTPLHRDA
ncbi:MAG: hypothetical protein ABI574_01005 [Burkholderiales bacterium]